MYQLLLKFLILEFQLLLGLVIPYLTVRYPEQSDGFIMFSEFVVGLQNQS